MITLLNGSKPPKRREIKLLFVDTGNLCRSPMAEAIMNHIIEKFAGRSFSKFDWFVSSAGLENYNSGELPEQRCLQVMHENRVSSIHCGRQIRNHDFKFHDYILAMETEHFNKLIEMAPETRKARIYLIGDFLKGREKMIRDPFHETGINAFRICFEQLYIACENFYFFVNERRL